MAQPPVGVDEQTTRHTSPPKGRFVLRADSIRPYGCGGRAADGSTNSRPLQSACAFIWVLAKIWGFGRMLCPYKVLFNAVSER